MGVQYDAGELFEGLSKVLDIVIELSVLSAWAGERILSARMLRQSMERRKGGVDADLLAFRSSDHPVSTILHASSANLIKSPGSGIMVSCDYRQRPARQSVEDWVWLGGSRVSRSARVEATQ